MVFVGEPILLLTADLVERRRVELELHSGFLRGVLSCLLPNGITPDGATTLASLDNV